MRPKIVLVARLGILLAIATCTEPQEPTVPRPIGGATADVVGSDPVFVGAGDIAECDRHSYDTDTLLQGIPGTVFTVGDNAYPNGADADYTNCYDPSWGREKARTYPAVGNHEYYLGNANGYFNYFGTSFGYPNGYYSYNLGAWHIVVLNSSGDPNVSTADGSPQVQWLKADLAANTSYCTLAIWHQSRFYSPLSTSDPGVDDDMKPLWVALYNAGADVALTGHEHQYERFAPQDNDGNLDPQTGLRSFVVGMGGAGLSGPNFTSTRRNSEVKNGVTWGVFKMTLHPTSYDWQFIPVKGQTFTDAGSASCHGTRPVVSAGYDQVVAPNVPLNLSATFTDVDNSSPWNYTITWGDGSTTSGTVTTPAAVDSIQATHAYTGTGQYVLSLAVTDNTGLTGSSYANVTVTNDNILVAAGNISRCDTQNDDRTADLLDHIGGTVITVGDNAYASGSLTEFQNCYAPTWGRSLPRTLPVPGDKDYQTSGASGYFSYFGAAAGQLGKGYYSYDLGTWHVIALNSSVSTAAGSAQEVWLKSDLAATNKRCIVAYFHYPLFSSQNGSQVWGTVQPLWNDLYAARADVVLGAHFQFYERFAQQTPAGVRDSLGGIREFVVGTGGQSWSSFGTPYPTSQVRSTQTWGVLKVTLNSASYDWQFIPIQGQTFTDAGSTACHTKGAVASVIVSPSSASLSPAGTVQLTATPQDAGDNPLLDRVVTWSSSNTSIATVSANGLVTAVASGPATITARSENKSGTAAITVNSAPVATVTVSPTPATIVAGYTQQLTASLYDANGNLLSGRIVTWSSDDPAVATVSNAGLVTAVAPGAANITATSEGKGATAAITVTIPVASLTVSPTAATIVVGGTQQLTATPLDANGNPLSGRTITWSSDAPSVATVNANGLVPAEAAGSANITAASEGKSGSAAITVIVPVASVSLSPTSATILVGGTEQLTATPLDANGNPLSGRAIIWSTDAASVATVNASGLVTGAGVGSASITATSEGKSGSSAITVPAAAPPVTLVGAGNIANCNTQNDDATAALIENIPGTVYTTGDNIYGDGSLTDFQNCYGPSWGRHKGRTRPASGHKDYQQPGAAGYWQYFGAVAGDSGKYDYSYDVGAWHVVVLNSQIDMSVGSAQELWLKADLAATAKRCTVAIWDQPRFSSTGTSVRSDVKPLWDDLYAAGAELVLNAHYRVYERFAPQTPAGVADATNGIRQFTVGTGGSTIDTFGTPIANSEVRATNLFGVLKLTLADGSYSWQFIPIAGQTFTDSGSGSCH